MLRKDNSIVSPDFKVLVMDADGKETEFKTDLNLYRGAVEGWFCFKWNICIFWFRIFDNICN